MNVHLEIWIGLWRMNCLFVTPEKRLIEAISAYRNLFMEQFQMLVNVCDLAPGEK